MYLKNLEINGFKSFGKKSVLEFNTAITAIVGPNGSGKSNVAEAFRFVLGEQSLKSMRGKKGEDLIFSGSNEAARGNRASVKLTFDNKKKFLNLDFDEVSIERVVYRDGGNEYVINGSKVRLRDVLELLASANIGSSGHHIISQGEADRILHSNPKERREMIEDALGIKIYQYKKEESEKRLTKTEENIKQVESLRREIAPHLKFLKKQVEKLEKAEELRREFVNSARIYFKKESIHLQNQRDLILNKKKEPELELRVLEQRLRELRVLVEEGLGVNKETPEILDIERKLENLREKKDSTLREFGKIEGELSFVKRSIQKEEHIQHQEEGKTVLLTEVEKVERDVAEIISTAGRDQGESAFVKALYKIQEVMRNFILRHKDNINSETLVSLQKELEQLDEKRKVLEKTLLNEKEEEEKLLSHYEAKKVELEKVKDETREAEKEIFRIVAKQNQMHAVLDKLKSEEREIMYASEVMKSDIGDFATVGGVEVMKFEEAMIDFREEERSEQLERKRHLERLKIRLEETGITGGSDILKEYKETDERDAFLASELVDLDSAKADLEKLIKELSEKLDQEFKEGVKKINDEFGKFFTLMFGGGHAGLRVVRQEKRRKNLGEEEDGLMIPEEVEAEEGIDIDVSLPHKKIKGLMMLSGGERALTSIALLFAISQVNPPPFVILDETDAALDEANSRKYGDMVESLAKHSELIVITHNRETMSRAGILYGVTMGKDATSKVLGIAFEEAEAVAK